MVRQKQAPEKKATVATIATDGKKVVKKVVKAPRTIIRGAIPAAKVC